MLNTKFKFETIHVKSDKIFPIVKMETNERTGEKYRVRPKLNEVVNLLNKLNKSHIVEDKHVLTMLRYYELVNELKKIGSK